MTIELPRIHSGKVRELYDAGDGRLLMVASDRVSAFDVIMAEPITDKGRVLTAMTTSPGEIRKSQSESVILSGHPGHRKAPPLRFPLFWSAGGALSRFVR